MSGCISDINIVYETAAVTNLVSDVVILALLFLSYGSFICVGSTRVQCWEYFSREPCEFTPFSVVRPHVSSRFLSVVVASIDRSVAYFKLQYNQDPNFSSQYYSLVIWTSVEPTLGVIGACLLTLRPLFSGMSPESIIGSIRSALSLHSFRSTSHTEDDREYLHHRGVVEDGFIKLSEPQGSVENHIMSLETEEGNLRREDVPGSHIMVQKEFG
ncbi:hypothetical protein OEA41_002356 [Lepraria neglecta]|uniref:Rhodopsin domain-containing protein n=1 Tax=Lepraria neglecta TaxID=209136 RepID=A0AAE0DMM3_9LECA|nr:hypothetical protein OEA41_002356 [Lepraria neglecta]